MSEGSQETSRRRRISGRQLLLGIVLILAYAAPATYGVMSDTSARGLTVKMYTVSRSCSSSSPNSAQTLSYSIGGAVWSSSSLLTSMTHVSFTLSVDGSQIETATGSDSSFGPGQSTTFNLSFTNPTLNPTTLPMTSRLVLDLAATVDSGLYNSKQVASDSLVQSFGTSRC